MCSFGFVEGIGALVLLPHPVDDEHDEEDGAEKTNHSTADHRSEDAGLGKEGDGSVVGWT